MADNTRNIQLTLQAKLDAQAAISQADGAGKAIAAAFSQAFEGLGAQIAENIVSAIQAKVKELRFDPNTLNLGFDSRQSAQIAGPQPPQSFQASYYGSATPPMPSVNIPPQMAGPFASPMANAVGSSTGRYSGGLSGANNMPQGQIEQMLNRAASFGREDLGEVGSAADITLMKAKAFSQLQKHDPNADAGKYLGENFYGKEGKDGAYEVAMKAVQEAMEANTELLDKVGKEIEALEETLRDETLLEKKMGQLKSEGNLSPDATLGDARKYIEASRGERLATANSATSDVKTASGNLDELKKLSPEAAAQKSKQAGFAKMAEKLELAGQVTEFVGDIPGMYKNFKAEYAKADQHFDRQSMNGNYEDEVASMLYGGKKGLNVMAGVGAAGQIGGNLLGNGAKVLGGMALGGAGAALSAIPVVGPLLGAGVAGLGASIGLGAATDSIKTLANAPGIYNNKRMELIRSQKEEDKPLFEMLGEARANSMNNYRSAQDMGSENYGRFLNGTEEGRYSAAGAGLSNASYGQGLKDLAQGMGGSFNGMNSLEGISGTVMDSAMKAKASGFGSIMQTSSAMFQGTTATGDATADREKALKDTEAMYTRAVRAGVEQSSAGKAMEQMAQNTAREGYGSKDANEELMNRIIGQAQAQFGHNVEGKQMQVVQDVTTGNAKERFSGSAVGDIAGIRMLNDMEKKTGINFGAGADAYQLRNTTLDKAGLQKMLTNPKYSDQIKKSGKSIDEIAGSILDVQSQASKYTVEQQRLLYGEAGVAKLAQDKEGGRGIGLPKAQDAVKASIASAGAAITPTENTQVPSGGAGPGKDVSIQQEMGQAVKLNEGMKGLVITIGPLNEAMKQMTTNMQTLAQVKWDYLLRTDH